MQKILSAVEVTLQEQRVVDGGFGLRKFMEKTAGAFD